MNRSMMFPYVFALAFGLALAACGGDDSGSDGSNNGFELCSEQEPVCLLDCTSDVAEGAQCVDGEWSCPQGTVDSSTCPDSKECVYTDSSTLPGASLEITGDRCNWTTEEAQQGVDIPFRIVVEQGEIINPWATDAGACEQPGPSGLITHGEVSGDGQQYCRCDVGMCPRHDPEWNTLEPGTYEGSFHFDAYNWQGPSDYGAQFGEPFPPGDYTLSIRSTGQRRTPDDGIEDFEVVGTMTIHLSAP